ncbi:sigma-70 family RNA polymerase sigma factor [Tautonia marina]|uniref:sigma-70 family RNA polymerase sigma factor n=1 Tax=Tautonia marina TaxID=2653855 RepID=UPI0012606FE0|nr:sigma-70 family RNA polymerase sigma factor [Tautonia marina]
MVGIQFKRPALALWILLLVPVASPFLVSADDRRGYDYGEPGLDDSILGRLEASYPGDAQLFKIQDPGLYASIVHHTAKKFLSTRYRLDAATTADIAQEIVTKHLQNDLSEKCSTHKELITYIKAACHFEKINLGRKPRHSREVPLDPSSINDSIAGEHAQTHEKRLVDRDILETLIRLSKLNANEKKVVRLCYLKEMTDKEASKKINLSGERVRQIRHDALRKLEATAHSMGLQYGVEPEELFLCW